MSNDPGYSIRMRLIVPGEVNFAFAGNTALCSSFCGDELVDSHLTIEVRLMDLGVEQFWGRIIIYTCDLGPRGFPGK